MAAGVAPASTKRPSTIGIASGSRRISATSALWLTAIAPTAIRAPPPNP